MVTQKVVRLRSGSPLALAMLCTFSMRGQQLPVPAGAIPGQGEVSANQTAAIASPPRVSCQGNQLTVDATSATLRSVLAAVHACLGIEITMPDGATDDRSFVRLGPGPTREVLDELLSSTKYSYAIQSSITAPGGIASILLMADVKDAGAAQDSRGVAASATAGTLRRAWMETVRNARTAGRQPDEGESSVVNAGPVTPNSSDGSTAPTTPNAAVGAAGTSDSAQPSNAADSPAAAVSPATAAAPSAPVQSPASSDPTQPAQPANELQDKIDSMQQMFQQRQKMTANPSQPPL